MKIIEALKNQDIFDIRISHEDKWMVWDKDENEWFVYQRVMYSKRSQIIYHGKSEEDAVKALLI